MAITRFDVVIVVEHFCNATIIVIRAVGKYAEFLPTDNPVREPEENGMSRNMYQLFFGSLQQDNLSTIRCHAYDKCGYYSNLVSYAHRHTDKATY